MNLVLWTSILSIWINPMSAVTVTLTSGIDDNGYTAKTHKIAGSRADVEITADTLDYGNKGSPNQYFPGNRIIHRSNAKTRWKEDEWEYFEPNISHVSFSRRKRNLGSNILIVQRFGPKIIAPGEDISLQCIATADRPPRFTWERDGVVITSNTDSRYTLGQTISGAGVTAQLNISRARVDDGGRYACSAGDARAVHAARIDVYGPPYIRTLPPIKVQSGEPLKLRCPYYGYPISKLEWENKGKKILTTTLPHISRYKRSYGNNIKSERRKGTNMLNSRGREKRQVFDSDEEGVLNIPSLEKEDNGVTYTCVVYSPSGEMARRAFEIQVVEAPVLDELRVGTGLKEGQIVQITCNIISGDPPIYFSWLKDGKKIPPNMKITERSSELFSVLIIKKVSLEHCGRYTCIATNHVGKVDQSSDLFINVAPKWVVEPSNSSLLLGRRGVVHCRADGHPAPQIHWMKKDATLGIWRPVLDLAGGGVMSYSNGTLVIEVVSLSDEGMYSCNVENGMGEPLNKNLWINVNKPVHFESAAMNLTTKKGLPINLTCKPLGDSPIRIKWSMDGRLIDFTTSRIAVSESPVVNGLKSIISISYTESKDAGHYECRASNPFGVASYNIYLDVLEPPPPPAEVAAWAAGGARAHLRWSSPRAPPAPRAHYYTVQYAPAGGAATALNVTRQDDILQTFELTNLQPATDYTVRVAAGNQVDLSPFSEPVHFTTQMEAPSSPPLGVQVQSTENPGELFISWMSPSKETHNGVLQGYHVKAVPKISGEQDSTDSHTKILKVISRNDKQETTMSGLLKNTRYAVSISAFNSAGNGPFSLPVYQTTREGAPESAPSGVECAGGAAAARAGWRPPAGGAPRGYHVYYAPDDGPWQNVTTPHTEIYLQGLLKYTNYSLKVAAFSSYGVGPFSYPVVCTTLQDVPDPPAAIKVLMSSPTSIIVSWKPPEHPNGEITHYTIDVKLISSSSPAISVRAEAAATWAAVRGLAAAAQYAVTVRAHTAAGAGGERAHHVHTVPRGHAGDARVVAGVASLGGVVAVGAGRSALLPCVCVGVPPPRTVWYHQHNIITHHPRFTRNHDDSLLINNIDQSLSGNYTCLAKNLYGSDSVSYSVVVLPAPAPPAVRVTSHKNSLHLQWDEPRRGPGKGQKIVYSLSWKQASGSWQDAFTNQAMSMHGVQEYTLEDLKCGTKYSIKMTATNSVGTSQPAYIEASTLGGVPIAPTTNEWFWSNSSHISIQLSGWDDNGCEIHTWKVEYKTRGGVWKLAKTSRPSPSSLSLGSLSAAAWYSIRVTATSDAGPAAATYRVATTTVTGEIIGPPSEFLDINMLVIICSSILLLICSVTCVYILVKRHQQQRLTSYRNSLTAECKSERSNVTVHTPQSTQPDVNTRVYSTPVHLHGDGKHELYEISPYAQFALGFRTLGHVENNEAPHSNTRYQTETSFQMRSESEESDCVSRTTTLKSAPRKACRIPHHR